VVPVFLARCGLCLLRIEVLYLWEKGSSIDIATPFLTVHYGIDQYLRVPEKDPVIKLLCQTVSRKRLDLRFPRQDEVRKI
jgi:hypothetical protein